MITVLLVPVKPHKIAYKYGLQAGDPKQSSAEPELDLPGMLCTVGLLKSLLHLVQNLQSSLLCQCHMQLAIALATCCASTVMVCHRAVTLFEACVVSVSIVLGAQHQFA